MNSHETFPGLLNRSAETRRQARAIAAMTAEIIAESERLCQRVGRLITAQRIELDHRRWHAVWRGGGEGVTRNDLWCNATI